MPAIIQARRITIVCICCTILLQLSGCGNSQNSTQLTAQATSTPTSAMVSISQGEDLFSPFIVVVPRNGTVIWKNYDNVKHFVATTPDINNFLNPKAFSFSIDPGSSVQFTFTAPGLYHYYDSSFSTWIPEFARVNANLHLPNFPLAMDGVIWVQGAIAGLPNVGVNSIPPDHDEFTSEFLAIQQNGSVLWHNFDSDPHFIGAVSGWSLPINPSDIGLNRIAGTHDVPGGDTLTLYFSQPGLYYYYCRNHNHIDPFYHRAASHYKASEYPLAMEGFVLVL